MYSTMKSVFRVGNHPIALRPCFTIPARDRSGGSSVIGYHLPQSVSVFVGDLFRRSANQLVVAQPGANARRWQRIFWGFHNTGNDVLQEHVRYGNLRHYERLKKWPLLKALRKFKGFFWSSKPEDALCDSQKVGGVDHRSLPC